MLNRRDFNTHLTYIERLNTLSLGLNVSTALIPKVGLSDLPKIENKMKLIELTKQSVDDEYKIVLAFNEYSTASVLWLPVKVYYLLYHTLSIIDFLLTAETKSLDVGHQRCIDKYTDNLANSSFVFSQPFFNNIYDKDILKSHETSKGEHFKVNASNDLIYKLVMKKAGMYKKQKEFERTKSKTKRQAWLANDFRVSIFDFIYYMRLRLNYKDLKFLNDIPPIYTSQYFGYYYSLGLNFHNAYSKLMQDLIAQVK